MSSEKTSFENSIKKLEKIVDDLEKGEYSLEESLKKFEEGLKLGRACKNMLEKAEGKVKMLVENDNGALKEREKPDDE